MEACCRWPSLSMKMADELPGSVKRKNITTNTLKLFLLQLILTSRLTDFESVSHYHASNQLARSHYDFLAREHLNFSELHSFQLKTMVKNGERERETLRKHLN